MVRDGGHRSIFIFKTIRRAFSKFFLGIFLQHCYSFLHYFYSLYEILQFSPEIYFLFLFLIQLDLVLYGLFSSDLSRVYCAVRTYKFWSAGPYPHGILVKKGTSEKQKNQFLEKILKPAQGATFFLFVVKLSLYSR